MLMRLLYRADAQRIAPGTVWVPHLKCVFTIKNTPYTALLH